MAKIPKTGIQDAQTIRASHITNIIESLDGTGSYDIDATGSFTGSFTGDGSGITGVTGEWDGTHVGDATITGSLNVSGSTSAILSVGDRSNPLLEIGQDINNRISLAIYADPTDDPDKFSISYQSSTSDTAQLALGATEIQIGDIEGTQNEVTLIIDSVNPSFTFLGNAPISASTHFSSSAASTASFGAFVGDGSQLTNITTASYVETAQTASYVTTAQTASYVSADNIDQPFASITASGDISASGDVFGVTGSFSHVVGASPLVINADNFKVFADGAISGSEVLGPLATHIDNLTYSGEISSSLVLGLNRIDLSQQSGTSLTATLTGAGGSNLQAGQRELEILMTPNTDPLENSALSINASAFFGYYTEVGSNKTTRISGATLIRGISTGDASYNSTYPINTDHWRFREYSPQRWFVQGLIGTGSNYNIA